MAPLPPVEMMVNVVAEGWALKVMAVLLGVAFLFALDHWRRSGRPVALMLFIAGGCMMIMEPMVDTVAACWFPADSQILYHGWGRPIPLWVCMTYFVYFGLGAATLWLMMASGMTRRSLWLFFGLEIVLDFILETVLLNAGVYTYYANQPLLVGRFPMWWAAVNSLISLSAAAVTFHLAPRLKGWKILALVPIVLCTSGAVNAAAGWPSWFVINSGTSFLVTQLGGLVTWLFALVAVQFIAVTCCSDGRAGQRAAAATA